MVQAKRVALYCRVSTADQSAERQERDLRQHAERCGYEVVACFTETASGARNDRKERAKVIAMARARQIDAVLVTELTRWGRSTADVITVMQQLAGWKVSLIAQTGIDFDLSTPNGKLMLTLLAGMAEFERDLNIERTMSGLATARAKGKTLGRPEGFNPSDKHAKKVLGYLAEGKSVRWIAEQLHISKTTVMAIKKRAS